MPPGPVHDSTTWALGRALRPLDLGGEICPRPRCASGFSTGLLRSVERSAARCGLRRPGTGTCESRNAVRGPEVASVGTRGTNALRGHEPRTTLPRRPNARPARRSEDAENRTGNGAVRRASAPRRDAKRYNALYRGTAHSHDSHHFMHMPTLHCDHALFGRLPSHSVAHHRVPISRLHISSEGSCSYTCSAWPAWPSAPAAGAAPAAQMSCEPCSRACHVAIARGGRLPNRAAVQSGKRGNLAL